MSEDTSIRLKLTYISGLRDIVLSELQEYPEIHVLREAKDAFYVKYIDDFEVVKKLRSVSRAYIVSTDSRYNPTYISKHKSVLGNLAALVIDKNEKNTFKTYKVSCAGSDSPEVLQIEKYLEETFRMVKSEEADLKVHIIKTEDTWEVGLQITPRPLSLREYKVRHMSGGMDPTVAYALNRVCELEKYSSYLNVFSGSGTLLIEAGQCFENLSTIIGFDNNKEHLSSSVQNIKKAGLIKKVQVKEGDIFDAPDFGTYDVITSDVPFGMTVSKGEDLEELYKSFITYAETYLKQKGRLGVYTSEFKLFKKCIADSKFILEKEFSIKRMTSEGQYLPTALLVYRLS